ncbi:hypothetical protein MSG28_011699 [Choristoneura fumiferana]|uniref:Uncharacterized protein n=2 Tax=Choristoneura fumiferana TaxID=7141 RepID=A0ACC0KLG1_CHOFU|nr:hypothetical protein MSG28_011699 [Choristoneura fumiferana]KAI8437359.1 hypothetical protein MSG28_011699 [Choristoneura fumiferana]
MVLWFRHSGGKPLYSFDVRGRSFNKALHWSDPLAFGRRAYFVTMSRPAALVVDAVQLDDEGVYRFHVYEEIEILEEKSGEVSNVMDCEGKKMWAFHCGRPQPTLTWLINNKPVEDHTLLKNDGKVVVSRISVSGAERSWLNHTVRCQATNTPLLSPHERTARVEMHFVTVFVDAPNLNPDVLRRR